MEIFVYDIQFEWFSHLPSSVYFINFNIGTT